MSRVRVVVMEPSPSGGLFQYAVALGRAMACAGHEVYVLTGPAPERLPPAQGADVAVLPVLPTWHPHGGPGGGRSRGRRLPRRLLRGLKRAWSWHVAARRSRALHPDLVLLSNLQFAVDGIGAQLAVRALGAHPVVMCVAHTPRPLSWRRHGDLQSGRRLVGRALRRGYEALDGVLVHGASSRDELLQVAPGARPFVVPHGMSESRTEDQPAPGNCPPTVLFFGTWARYKGLDVLLEAFATVRSRCPEARLVVAGAPTKDVDVDEVRRRARTLGGVDVRAGYVPPEDVAALFGSCRVVAVPYLVANQSGVVHQGAGFGRPVVASRVGDLPEAVDDGVTGTLVPPGDAGALAEALLVFLTCPGRADEVGAAARARAARSSWAATAAAVLRARDECT